MRPSPLHCLLLASLVACGTRDDPSIARFPVFGGDPVNHAVFAVDVSHWEGPMSQAEMDCLWDEGVRHLIAGTQKPDYTRQQLDLAMLRGHSIDAYVFLFWRNDIEDQVRTKLEAVKDYPLGRFWLDMEDDRQGGVPTLDLAKRAVAACRAASPVPCGIYSEGDWWKSFLANTTELADVPLWYARYNDKTTLSDWTTEKFGGWTFPVGKQFAEKVLCGVGLDQNVMQLAREPMVVVDRTPVTPPAGVPGVPPPPYYPSDGAKLPLNSTYNMPFEFVRMVVGTTPGATQYQFELQSWSNGGFVQYYTWTASAPALKQDTPYLNRTYRFRARAGNAQGWGPWTRYNVFDYGTRSAAGPTDCTGKPDGTVCATEQACSAGLCGFCPLGNLCVSTDGCQTGQVACTSGVTSCTGLVPRQEGSTCPGPGTCHSGVCSPPTDAGSPPTDAGSPPTDAGSPPTDAGLLSDGGAGEDAGTPDAGAPFEEEPPPTTDGVVGCSCQATPGGGLALAWAFLLASWGALRAPRRARRSF